MKTKETLVLETVPNEGGRDPRPGPHPILWEWLARYPFIPSKWSLFRRKLRKRFKGKWLADGCRHTGATYYSALYGAAATAELLGHRSVAMVKRHYDGRASRKEAEEFFAIGPDSITFSPKPIEIWPIVVDGELKRAAEAAVF